MDGSMLAFAAHHQLPEDAQTHIHWVGDALKPPHALLSPSPPAFSLSQHQGLLQWVSSLHQMAKVLELQLQRQSFQRILRTVSPSKEYSGLISFRMDWFDFHVVRVTLKNLSQHHSSKTSNFQCSAKASHVLDPDKIDEFSNYILLWQAVYACMVNRIWFFVTPWTIAHQAPLSMGFSRKE